MSKKYKLDDDAMEKLDSTLDEQYYGCLSDSDFYPLYDNRVFESYIEDIDGGDNFTDYCEYIFELLEEEGYYD